LNILFNQDTGNGSKKPNCRVQVLPVQWRQEIQFGVSKDSYDGEKKIDDERDIGDLADEDIPEDTGNATLKDITVEGLAPIRSLISDGTILSSPRSPFFSLSPPPLFSSDDSHPDWIVLLDILLYYTPQFRERMVRAVSREMNRIYHLFLTRNPTFTGRVSLVGHSLGSAICFDILCRQPLSSSDSHHTIPKEFNLDKRLELDFEVHGFFAVGSPVGLFQMLRGRNIAARGVMERRVMVNTPLGEEFRELVEKGEVPISCPKVHVFFEGLLRTELILV
jgi:hypothetical protein